VVQCGGDWSARALCLHGKGRGLIDAARLVQLLIRNSIVVFSLWELELGRVGWRQGRKAARWEGHLQSEGNKEEAGRQTLHGTQSKECMPRTSGELRSALCSMLLRSVVGEAEEVSPSLANKRGLIVICWSQIVGTISWRHANYQGTR
jgi:hypothetical protein